MPSNLKGVSGLIGSTNCLERRLDILRDICLKDDDDDLKDDDDDDKLF
eukprot:CAMPEP_0203643806 /NCGR_PEP_ID=MMETSP0088-20131115/9244_1 /ASSEMBLY_ACC=CAM_ASM_001087 /TAXON_ID=426623 /ORGANISM="Chaetoceros affinis, Strain CCMP159" /LENGTH=47 /DNA_ID= /DNA_START= /DNA_END= /DNA_ORIENTATION=